MTTIKDIAVKLGISHSTVSRALGGYPHVNEDLRRSVQEAARQMNYQPNMTARRLKDMRTRVIGLLIPDLMIDFYARSSMMIQTALAAANFRLFLATSGNDPSNEAEYLRAMQEERVEGVIWSPWTYEEKVVQAFSNAGVPVIQFGRMVSDRLDAILPDDCEGTRVGTEHLIANGHTRIALLVGQMNLSSGRARLDGYRRALEAAGLREDHDLVKVDRFHRDWGREAMAQLLDLPEPPTAVMAASSLLLVGALQTLQERSIAVPEQVSLVALGDPEWYALWRPPITSIAFASEEMSTLAVSRLLDRIQAATLGMGVKPIQRRIAMPFIPRGSVAPRL